jgi:hypothetical protein
MRRALVVLALSVIAAVLLGVNAFAATGWTPPAHITSWQWQLSGTLNTSVKADVYDVDWFDTSAAQVAALHAVGRHVICYVDVGGVEPYRPDYYRYTSADKGNTVSGWDEFYADTRSANVRSIIKDRIVQQCAAKGFDAVETDLDDTWLEGSAVTGGLHPLPLNQATGLDFLQFLSSTIQSQGLAWFAKNGADPVFQSFASSHAKGEVNEECSVYSECGVLATNIPILHAEYTSSGFTKACNSRAKYPNETIIKKSYSLTAKVSVCS